MFFICVERETIEREVKMTDFVIPPSAQPNQPVKPTPPAQKPVNSASPSEVSQYLHVEPEVVKLALQKNPWLKQYFDASGTLKTDKIPTWAKQLKTELKGQPVQTLILYDKVNPRIEFLYGYGPKQGQPLLRNGQPLILPIVPPKTPVVGQGDYLFGGPGSVQVLPDWPHPKGGTLLPGQAGNPMGLGAVGIALAEGVRLNDGQLLPVSELALHNWYPTPQGQKQINQWLAQSPRPPQSNGCFRSSAEDMLGAMLILGNTPAENGLDSARLVDGYDAVLRRKPNSRVFDLMLVQSDMRQFSKVQVLPPHGQGRQVSTRQSVRQLKNENLATIKAHLSQGLPQGAQIQWQDADLKAAKNQSKAQWVDVGDVTLP